jgi:hypothetical protein
MDCITVPRHDRSTIGLIWRKKSTEEEKFKIVAKYLVRRAKAYYQLTFLNQDNVQESYDSPGFM